MTGEQIALEYEKRAHHILGNRSLLAELIDSALAAAFAEGRRARLEEATSAMKNAIVVLSYPQSIHLTRMGAIDMLEHTIRGLERTP